MTVEETPFVVLVHERGEVPVVKVSGTLDIAAAPRFRATLERVAGEMLERSVLERSVPGLAVVDLGGVEFMDSCGISALVGGTRRLVAGGGKVRLVIKDSPVVRTLEVTGLDRIFEVYPDVGSASCRGVA